MEAGRTTADDVAREYRVRAATIYAWKPKFGDMDARDAQRLRSLEDENSSLTRLIKFGRFTEGDRPRRGEGKPETPSHDGYLVLVS
jgi:transposase